MYCGKCGKVNTDGIRFCVHCGADMAQQTPQPVNPSSHDETIEDTDALREDMLDAGRTPGTGGSRGSDSGDVPHGRIASVDALREGRTLAGRYKILGRLGVGGMGEVFKAVDSELNDMTVAIKVLPPLLAANTRSINRLRTEAAIALKLTHPNICRLHTFRVDGDLKFLVMEYIEGQTLEEMLDTTAERKLTLDKLLPIAANVADALDFAHKLQPPILHRDIKPSNIMVDPTGRGKVLDFGIARELKDSMTRLTGKDTSGTLLYMSPEQFTGSTPTTASDVYSFAAMIYECLGGHAPFWQGSIAHQLLNQAPSKIPDLPSHVNDGLIAGLAKNGTDRPATARELVRILEGKAPAAVGAAASGAGGGKIPPSANAAKAKPADKKAKPGKRHKAGGDDAPTGERSGGRKVRAMVVVLAALLGVAATGVWQEWWLPGVRSMFSQADAAPKAPEVTVDDVVTDQIKASAMVKQLDVVESDETVGPKIAAVKNLMETASEQTTRKEYASAMATYKDVIARSESILKRDANRKRATALRGGVLAARSAARRAKAVDLASDAWKQAEKLQKMGEEAFTGDRFAEALLSWQSAKNQYDRATQLAGYAVKISDEKKMYDRNLDEALKRIPLAEIKKYGGSDWRKVEAAIGAAESAGVTQQAADMWKKAAENLAAAWPKAVAERKRLAGIEQHMERASIQLEKGDFDQAAAAVKDALALEAGYEPALLLQHTIDGARLWGAAQAIGQTKPVDALAKVSQSLKLFDAALGIDAADSRTIRWKARARALRKELAGLFDPRSQKKLSGHGEWVKSLAVSPDGRRIVSGSEDDTVKLWDLEGGHCIRTIRETANAEAVAFSADGKLLAWTSGSEVRLCKVAETAGKPVTLKGHIISVLSVAIDPTGTTVATGSSDNTAKLWDAETGKCIATLKHQDDVTCVVFSPASPASPVSPASSAGGSKGSSLVATAGKDKHIRLWDTQTAKMVKDLTGHEAKTLAIAFSPDGKLLASGDSDWKVRVWDVGTGKVIRTLDGHNRAVCCVAFGPFSPASPASPASPVSGASGGGGGSSLLASAGGDGTVRLWNVADGRCLQKLQGHGEDKQIEAVVFTPDGKRLVSCGEDGGIVVWTKGLTAGG